MRTVVNAVATPNLFCGNICELPEVAHFSVFAFEAGYVNLGSGDSLTRAHEIIAEYRSRFPRTKLYSVYANREAGVGDMSGVRVWSEGYTVNAQDCPKCEGRGAVMSPLNIKCDACDGTGSRFEFVSTSGLSWKCANGHAFQSGVNAQHQFCPECKQTVFCEVRA